MGDFYTAMGQGVQGLGWSVLVFVVALIIAAGIVGSCKKLITKNRLKWFVVHTIIILILGVLISLVAMNGYLEVLVTAVLFTLLVKLYRRIMNKKEKWVLKDILKWFVIYLMSFYTVMAMVNMTGTADGIIRVVFAGLFVTLTGAIFSLKK